MSRCTTFDCLGSADRYVTCEGEGEFPYCAECSATLIGVGETDKGPTQDGAERDALADAVEEYLLWEPGRAGHAAAHRALVAALRKVRPA